MRLLLLWRIIRRLRWISESAIVRLIGVVVLHWGRGISKPVAEAVSESVIIDSVLSRIIRTVRAIHIRRPLHAELLQRGLIGRGDQLPAVEGWIVHELPLVVFLLLVKFPDCLVLADTGDAHDGRAAESRIR